MCFGLKVFFLLLFSFVVNAGSLFSVGDIHADVEALKRILVGLGLIDSQDKWIGGTSQLVTMGDHLDRGPNSRAVLDLLMNLETEARSSGGRVVNLIGNHEFLTVSGQHSFANYQDVLQYRDFKMGARGNGYEHAFVGNTRYAQWFRSRPAMELIDGTLFVHAGLSEKMLSHSLTEINSMVQDWLRFQQGVGPEPSPATDWVVQRDGPLWTRSLSYQADTYKTTKVNDQVLSSDLLDRLLKHFGAKRVVIGHSLIRDLENTINHPFYGSRVITTDTGISIADKLMVTGFKFEGDVVTVYEFNRGNQQTLRTLRSGNAFSECRKIYGN